VLAESGAVVLLRVGRALWARAAGVMHGRAQGAGGLTLQERPRPPPPRAGRFCERNAALSAPLSPPPPAPTSSTRARPGRSTGC